MKGNVSGMNESPTVGWQSLSSFFTIARFGPDTLVIFGILAIVTFALIAVQLPLLSYLTAVTLLVIFLVESFEMISLQRAEKRQIVGAMCFVIKRVSIGERGVARLFSVDGKLDPETWSIESTSILEVGQIGVVTGLHSIILEISHP
jgi:membrane protein implicated in regulation of membrane protease activity